MNGLFDSAVQNERPKQRTGALKRHRAASDASDLQFAAFGVNGSSGVGDNSNGGPNPKQLAFSTSPLPSGIIVPLAFPPPIASFSAHSFQTQRSVAATGLSFESAVESKFASVPIALSTDEFQSQQRQQQKKSAAAETAAHNVAAQFWLQRQMQIDWNGALFGFGQLLRAQQTQLQALSLSHEPQNRRESESFLRSKASVSATSADKNKRDERPEPAAEAAASPIRNSTPKRAEQSSGADSEHMEASESTRDSSDLKLPDKVAGLEGAFGQISGGSEHSTYGHELETPESCETVRSGRDVSRDRPAGQLSRRQHAPSVRLKSSSSFVSIADILGLHGPNMDSKGVDNAHD